MNAARSQSDLVDLDDPIQVHLLTESALFDSRRFAILSQEEVDDLKKQCQTLNQRIEKTRSNLAVQTRYRDAAISMAKLYSPARSSAGAGSRGSNRESAEEAELERQATERRCNELAAELSSFETRLMSPQRRLLEHTAGILQLTHKPSKKQQIQTQHNMPVMNGMPGSPESLYTYSNDRNSGDGVDGTLLDFPEPPSRMRAAPNPLEIPPRSPVREQTEKLREERDQLQRENDELRAQFDALGVEVDAMRRENFSQDDDATELEHKLESLNSSLRDVIVMFDPTKNSNYPMAPSATNRSPTGARGLAALRNHVEYLTGSIATIKDEQEQQPSRSRSVDTSEATPALGAMAQAEDRIDDLNKQMTDLLLSVNATPPPPPNPADIGRTDLPLDDRITYLQYSLRVVEMELVRAVENSNNALPMPTGDGDAAPKLKELWDIVQSGFLELQSQREARQRIRAEKGFEDDEDMTVDQTFDLQETYSAVGLQSRVRTVSSQLWKLTEQKAVLKRQIKQQRELNNKSSSEKDIELENKDAEIEKRIGETQNKEIELQGKIAELDAKEAEVAELNSRLIEAQSAAGNGENNEARIKDLEAELAEAKRSLEQERSDGEQTQGMLSTALRDLDTSKQDAETRESDGLREARAELEEKRTRLAAAESSSQALESKFNTAETSRAELQAKMDAIDDRTKTLEVELQEARAALREAEEAAEVRQRELDGRQRDVKEKDDVLESLNLMIAELKTELTIARAELDGAYGSRAERAADAAAIKSSGETGRLREQVDTYKDELEKTLKQLEEITRETMSAEKEKVDAEARLDEVVTERGVLEAEVRELTEKLDGEMGAARGKIDRLQEELDSARLKGGSAEGGGRAGAAMLSEQFRTTMRGERRKFQEELRVSAPPFHSLVPVIPLVS